MSPAHLRKIYDDTCTTCSRKATQRLYNTRNALIGCYCAKHAPAALQRQQRQIDHVTTEGRER